MTGPLDGLSLRIKMAAFGGLILASPVILWELWRFVTPGLRRNEKRYAMPFVVASMRAVPAGLRRRLPASSPTPCGLLDGGRRPAACTRSINPNNYLGLILLLMAALRPHLRVPGRPGGARAGRRGDARPSCCTGWRWAVIGITVASPPSFTPSSDPFSMLALAVPLIVFYVVAIVIGKLLRR